MRMRELGLASALALSVVATPSLAQDIPEQLTLRSGVAGGSWFPIGASMIEILSAAGVRGNAEPGGAAGNLVAIDQGQVELGFTMTMLPALAAEGADPFPQTIDNIAGISVVFPNFAHVMVREDSEVTSLEDLEGKSFASQPIGTGTQIVFSDMLEVVGLTEEDLDVTRGGQGHGADQVRDRQAVGLTATTAAPSGTLTELATGHSIRFLGLDDDQFEAMKEINPGYVRATLPAGTYPGQDEDVAGVGTDTILVVSEDMSEDHAYWITKTLVEGIERLNAAHGSMRNLTPEGMAAVAGVDLHPGARRYYEEAGILQ